MMKQVPQSIMICMDRLEALRKAKSMNKTWIEAEVDHMSKCENLDCKDTLNRWKQNEFLSRIC